MNQIERHLEQRQVTAPPAGWRGLILRAQVSPVGYRIMRVHDRLLARVGALGYSFLVCVVLPSLAVAAYLTLWASDEYESEARFTVRAANETTSNSLNDALSMFSSLGISKSTGQDVYVVADYIRSRVIIEDLGGKPFMHQLFSKSAIDWVSRLSPRATFEDAWKYWNRKVTAVINTQASIITVKVRAYSSPEAHNLSQLIVERSEALVNEISERSRNDALKRADAEVQAAMKRASSARQAMLDWRNKANVINPVSSASSIGTTLTQLMKDKLLLENSRGALSDVMDKNSPTQRLLQTQIDSLDKQIAQLQARLTSQQSENVISGQISTFEELQLETQFAEKILTIAQSAYERARMEQDKQQLYLVPIVRPTVPEKAIYPQLSVAIPMVFAVFLALWGMFSLVIASIRDHLG
jgi:capsular polysaccharide transport system permease protein